MEKLKFDQIVIEMEELNRRSPKSYRAKVARFSALGYGVFVFTFSVVIIVLTILVLYVVANGIGSGSIRLIIIVGALTYMFIRAMWVKVEAPEGREVTAEEAPALHAEIERIRAALGAPRIHKVLLIDDFNAFASTSSKLMIFGQRCYIALGLPLLLTQSPDEVSATIAHELAHHSKSHVKAGNRAYRLEAMWGRLLMQFSESGSLMSYPMTAFVKWYAPRYSALTLVLRRQAEYEADALGAEATSKEAMAFGLLRMSIDQDHRISQYHTEVKGTLSESETAPAAFYRGLFDFPREEGEMVVETLRRTLRAETVVEDSHPCARERTEALGIEADPENDEVVRNLMKKIGVVEETAAQRFLGDNFGAILDEFDHKWQVEQQPEWSASRVSQREDAETIEKLAARDESTWNGSDAVAYMRAYVGVHGSSPSKLRARELTDKFPAEAELFLIAGYCLLLDDEAEGVAFVERAVEIDDEFTAAAHELIAGFHAHQGDSKAARSAALKAEELREQDGEEYAKLAVLKPSDELYPIEVKATVLDKIRERLPIMKRVVEAYAFHKVSPDRKGIKLDIVVLVVKRPMMVTSDESFIDSQLQEAFIVFEGQEDVHMQVMLDKSSFVKRLASLPETRIYSSAANGDD